MISSPYFFQLASLCLGESEGGKDLAFIEVFYILMQKLRAVIGSILNINWAKPQTAIEVCRYKEYT